MFAHANAQTQNHRESRTGIHIQKNKRIHKQNQTHAHTNPNLHRQTKHRQTKHKQTKQQQTNTVTDPGDFRQSQAQATSDQIEENKASEFRALWFKVY